MKPTKKIPLSQKEMSVNDWRSFSYIKDLDLVEFEFEAMEAFLNRYEIDIDEIDIEEARKYSFIFEVPKGEKIEGEKEGFKLMDFKKMTLGDFVDLERILSKKDFNENLKAIAILFRRFKIDNWGNEIHEPRKYNLDARLNDLGEILTINEATFIINEASNYVNKILKSYSVIFQKQEDEDELELTEEELKHEKELASFKWLRFIFYAAGGDVLKMKKAAKENHLLIFNTIAMQKKLKIEPK